MVEDLRMAAGPSTGAEMAGKLNFSAPLGHFITASADAPSRTIHGRRFTSDTSGRERRRIAV
jgi:hypothetical protein